MKELIELAVEFREKAHRYGLWIARLEAMPPSHSDPIATCKSPGCVHASDVIARALAERAGRQP